MSNSNTSNTSDLGNTSLSQIRSRRWCFTLNNYTNAEYDTILKYCIDTQSQYIIGKEVGENNTPHLQCYFEFKNARSLATLKGINNRAHYEKAKGTKKDNFIYCSKEHNYISNIDILTFQEKIDQEILNTEYKNVVWKSWQKEILDLIKTRPDNRKIHWYFDVNGNVGKTYLLRYIDLTNKGVILAEGKGSDVFNQIKCSMDNEEIPKLILLDIPRHNKDFINYGLIEKIKSGTIYSGKYEGGKCRFPIPHIIIFSNDEPDYNKWSRDRYDVHDLTNL